MIFALSLLGSEEYVLLVFKRRHLKLMSPLENDILICFFFRSLDSSNSDFPGSEVYIVLPGNQLILYIQLV